MPGSPVFRPAPELPAGVRSALVIATSSYDDPELRQLRSPGRDAADLAAVLGDPGIGGFSVTSVIDETEGRIRRAIGRFCANRGLDDLILIYLSCHGLLDSRGRLYFAAADTEKQGLSATAVMSDWLINQLDESRARHQVLILDCCFSGSFAGGVKGDVELESRLQGRGRRVLTASRAREYSYEGEPVPGMAATGSVFTAGLIDGLRTGAADADRDGLITLDEAYSHTADYIREHGNRQTPQRWLYGAEGDIVIARSPAGVAVTATPLPQALRISLESPFTRVRIGAVNELAEWLAGDDAGRALTARRALEDIAAADAPAVATVAREHLAALEARPAVRGTQPGTNRTAGPETTTGPEPRPGPGLEPQRPSTSSSASDIDIREGTYGARVVTVEPGGAEFIPLAERHGKPLQLFWTWSSPNMVFATIVVGLFGAGVLGLSFWSTVTAIVLGTLLASITQGILSTSGPTFGVPQMLLGRRGFGYWGNILPAGLNVLVGGIGWFAVTSATGALALNALTHMPDVLCLLIVVTVQLAVAFFGHNLIHVFARCAFPVLVAIFLIASWVVLVKGHPHLNASHGTSPGAFLIELGAAFGYAAAWNPYASDYTRYLKPQTSKSAIILWSGLGLFLSCSLLEVVGAAVGTIPRLAEQADAPIGAFIGMTPAWLGNLTLLATVIGTVAGNALNIYSGALSFNALGFKLPLSFRRATVVLGLGTIGFFLAWSALSDAGVSYTNLLLVTAYWIAPWLAVMFCDMILRARGKQPAEQIERLLFNRAHTNWAGPVAMAAGTGISVLLFSNQTDFVGVVPRHLGSAGDLTCEVGFVLTAVIYLGWRLIGAHGETALAAVAVPGQSLESISD